MTIGEGKEEVKIPLSKDAPGHKGMLARAMEKDLKEAKEREKKEQEEIMNQALNDPVFRQQMASMGAPAQKLY